MPKLRTKDKRVTARSGERFCAKPDAFDRGVPKTTFAFARIVIFCYGITGTAKS